MDRIITIGLVLIWIIIAALNSFQLISINETDKRNGYTSKELSEMLNRCEANLPRNQKCGLTAIPIPIKDPTKY